MSSVLIVRDTSIVPAAFGWFSTAIAERRLRGRDSSSDSWGADCNANCSISTGKRSAERCALFDVALLLSSLLATAQS
jgi:hypothetical protein